MNINKQKEFQIKFLNLLFNSLENYNIKYCILRNYKDLPESINSKDIDFILEKKDLNKLNNILYELIPESNINYFYYNKSQYIISYRLFSVSKYYCSSIKIDFFLTFGRRGAKYLKTTKILEKRRKYKNFYIPNPVHEAIISWLQPLIHGGVVKIKYKNKINSVFIEYPQEFINCSNFILGKLLTQKLLRYIRNNRLEKTVFYVLQIRLMAWIRSCSKEPYNVIKDLLVHFCLETKRRLFPSKRVIAIIGPDGVGKSTVINRLKDEIARIWKIDLFHIVILHFRPNIIPNLKKLATFGRIKDNAMDFEKPHRSKQSGFFGSLFRLSYYIIDYIIGYFFKVNRLLAKGNIVIFDRYYYDFIVDPARSRVKLPKFIPFMLSKIIPTPSLTVLIDVEPNIIFKRKQELTKEELRRQVIEYRNLSKKIPNMFVVDGKKSIDGIIKKVGNEYIKKITIPINSNDE